jgi:hypothetical protein
MPLFSIIGSSQVAIPAVPKWAVGAPVGSAFDLKAAVLRQSPGCKMPFISADADYCLVPLVVLDAAVGRTLKVLAAEGIGYTKNAWDCEDFVNELHQNIRKMAAKAGILRAPVTCGLAVANALPWANVPAGNGHEVACVLTDEGPMVVEPQNGIRCPLAAYPNRGNILELSNL